MINYLLESSISLTILILVYHLLFRNDRLFVFKRCYLLFALVFSLIIPIVELNLNVHSASNETILSKQNQFTLAVLNDSIIEPIQSQFETSIQNLNMPVYSWILMFLYSSVLVFLLFRLVGNFKNLMRKARNLKYDMYKDKRVVLDSMNASPYSFFNCIYVNDKEYEQGLISEDLLNHEIAHIKQLHSIDIVFIEILHTILWFNPLIFLYKYAMRANHEFLADSVAIKKSNKKKDYYEALVNFTFRNSSINLVSGFNYSLIKKRLKMMTKNKAKAFSVYKTFLILPVILFISLGFSGQSNSQKGMEMSTRQINKKTDDSDITREFTGVKTIDISTVSGNCQVMRSDNSIVKVSLTHHYKPARTFEPIFEQEGDLLKLRENMTGSNTGSSDWILLVPEQTNIYFNSASGAISIQDVSGKIIAHTASGTVSASNIIVSESSEFTSASGSVSVVLTGSPVYDVLVSSSSGKASLDFNGNPVTGTIEMKARTDKGKIDCPFRFDTEKEELNGDQSYIVRSAVIKSESPVIKIYTASGTAKLQE